MTVQAFPICTTCYFTCGIQKLHVWPRGLGVASRKTNDTSDPMVCGRGFQPLIGYIILIIVLERTDSILLEPHVRLSHPKSFACNTASSSSRVWAYTDPAYRRTNAYGRASQSLRHVDLPETKSASFTKPGNNGSSIRWFDGKH